MPYTPPNLAYTGEFKPHYSVTPPANPSVGDPWYKYTSAGKLLSLLYWNGTKWVTPDQEGRRVESVTSSTGLVGRFSIPGLAGHTLNLLSWGFAGLGIFVGSESYLMSVTAVRPNNYTFSNFSILNANYQEVEAFVTTGSPVVGEGVGTFRFTGSKAGGSSSFSIDGSFFVKYRYEHAI